MLFKSIDKSARSVFYIVSVSIGFFSFIGCSYFFNLEKQEFKISYKSQSGSCISEANKTITDYFDKDYLLLASEDQIDQFKNQIDQFKVCYQESIESFVKHTTSGRLKSENYSAENIVSFLRKFYPEVKVSLQNVEYYLTLKQFLIGGEANILSKDELLIISDSLASFSELLKEILPYRSIYLKKAELNKNREDFRRFNVAFEILIKKVIDFIRTFEKFNGDRSVDLRSAIRFFLNQLKDRDPEKPFTYMNIIISFKNLSILSEGDLLKRKNLKTCASQFLLAYKGLMMFDYFVKENHLFENIGGVVSYLSKALTQLNNPEVFRTIALRGIASIVDDAHKILSHPIQESSNGQLPYEKVHDLLVSLDEAGSLGNNLTAEILDLFIRKFSKKWLDPGSEETIHFTMAKISYVRDIYFLWFQRQQAVNTLFSDSDTESVSLVSGRRKLKGFEPLENWIKILEGVSVHQWDENNQMFLENKMNSFSYRELTLSNSFAFLSEIFMRPYNLFVKQVHEYRIKKEEVQEIYEILRILGIPLGFMDSRVVDSGYKVFYESNNFSTRKKNDGFMDFGEVYEYLSFVLSSFRLGERFYQNINDDCLLDYVDVHNSPVVKASCFRSSFREKFDTFFEHLKTVSSFWKKSSDIQKDKFMGTVEYVAREGLLSDVPFKSGEIRTMSVSLYYLESIFFSFDYNGDGFISGTELRNIQLHFETFINRFLLDKLSNISRHSDKTIKVLALLCSSEKENIKKIIKCLSAKIFLFLLNAGELPSNSAYHKSFFLIEFMSDEQDLFDKTRADVHSVFRFFSMMGRENHKSLTRQLKDFLLNNKDALYSELSDEKSPDCTEQKNENLKFCQWAQMIRCDETVKPRLYQWMKDNKYSLFPEKLWDETPDNGTVETMELFKKLWDETPDNGTVETMKLFSSSFRLHQRFSVHCYFPEYRGETSGFFDLQWLVNLFEGDEEERGLKDDAMGLWKSVRDSLFGNED